MGWLHLHPHLYRLGSKSFAKERMDVFSDGKVISLDDFQSLNIVGDTRGWHSTSPEKGQLNELQALAECLQSGSQWPIPLDQQISAMDICFQVEEQL